MHIELQLHVWHAYITKHEVFPIPKWLREGGGGGGGGGGEGGGGGVWASQLLLLF